MKPTTTTGTREGTLGFALACASTTESVLRSMLAHERIRMDYGEQGSAQAVGIILRELHARGLTEHAPNYQSEGA